VEWVYSFALIFSFAPILYCVEYVTCIFSGQLGNQLFEAAACIGYALDYGCEARFPDLVNARDAEENLRYVLNRLNRDPFPEGTEFISHAPPGERLYAPIPHYKGHNVRIDGFCQAEGYFSRHEEAIRQLFGPTDEILEAIYWKYGHLLQETTVAVHVRTFQKDGWDPRATFQTGYYLAAMNEFPKDAHFLVFSDSPEWTKSNFPKGGRKVTFIEGNPAYFDFYFMSLCDHQIVSYSSTFSWWAAWLNSNPDKIVVAADPFRRTRRNDDFIPKSWIKH